MLAASPKGKAGPATCMNMSKAKKRARMYDKGVYIRVSFNLGNIVSKG